MLTCTYIISLLQWATIVRLFSPCITITLLMAWLTQWIILAYICTVPIRLTIPVFLTLVYPTMVVRPFLSLSTTPTRARVRDRPAALSPDPLMDGPVAHPYRPRRGRALGVVRLQAGGAAQPVAPMPHLAAPATRNRLAITLHVARVPTRPAPALQLRPVRVLLDHGAAAALTVELRGPHEAPAPFGGPLRAILRPGRFGVGTPAGNPRGTLHLPLAGSTMTASPVRPGTIRTELIEGLHHPASRTAIGRAVALAHHRTGRADVVGTPHRLRGPMFSSLQHVQNYTHAHLLPAANAPRPRRAGGRLADVQIAGPATPDDETRIVTRDRAASRVMRVRGDARALVPAGNLVAPTVRVSSAAVAVADEDAFA
jgi:hypothetical protein